MGEGDNKDEVAKAIEDLTKAISYPLDRLADGVVEILGVLQIRLPEIGRSLHKIEEHLETLSMTDWEASPPHE